MGLADGEVVEGHWVLLRRPDDRGGVQMVGQEVGDFVTGHWHCHNHVDFARFSSYQIFNYRVGKNLNVQMKIRLE